MAAELYNGWYVSANQYDVGPSSGTASSYQEHNVDLIYAVFSSLGWTDNAIAGMLGNMMYESCLDPACVYPKSSFPHGGASLEDLDNNNAIGITNSAYGLVQWLGTTTTPPAGNQLVSYAIRHGYQWYDGDIQMQRLTWEYQEPAKFHPQTVDGVYYTFASYASSTDSPSVLAKAWMVCYEGTYSVLSTRQQNAENWYDYIHTGPGPEPPTPDDWITGLEFTALALAYDPDITGVPIPYSQMDCIQFVQAVWRDIDSVSSTDRLVPSGSTLGTNTLWRLNISPYPSYTFNTTSPDSQNPTPVLWWKGTISECEAEFGEIPPGALLFHQIGEDDNPPIPSQYRGDGIGNFAHVGIYCGWGTVMQSGGRDSGSIPGGGVHKSNYDSSAWNYVAFVVYVDCQGSGPTPPPPPPTPWILENIYLLATKKKEVRNNVKIKWCF